MATGMYGHMTATIVEKVAELLCAPVAAVDADGKVIASSDSSLIGLYQNHDERVPATHTRVPLPLNGKTGEIIVGESTSGESVPPRVAQALVELMIKQSALHERRPHRTELKNQLIYDLLHGVVSDEPAILREARNLGMNLEPPRAVLLIDAGTYILAADDGRTPSDAQLRRRAQIVIGSIISFFHLPNDTICAYIGNGEVAVLKASDSKNLASWIEPNSASELSNPSWMNLVALRSAGEALLERLRSDTAASVSIGIGRYHPGLLGMAQSYQDARVALTLGRRFNGHDHVHSLDALGIAAFVGIADETTKVELATYLLSPLDHECDLLETLNAFFAENCSPSSTAARLAIHRNTLTYRFDKIRLLSGLDPRHFDDAVQIRLALVLRSLLASNA